MTGRSCRLTLICKDEKESSTELPFVCEKTKCDNFCSKKNEGSSSGISGGWGKCKQNGSNNNICQCFYLCYKKIHLPQNP